MKKFLGIVEENCSWLVLAILFFLAGYAMAFAALQHDATILKMVEETSLTLLRELGEQIFAGHPLRGIAILFLHNLSSTIQIMLFGLLLGLPALASAITNGAILGIVAFQLTQEGMAPLPYLAAGILPHGLFELPAFFLSAAFGLKLGYHVVFPAPGQTRKETLRGIFREIASAFPYIFSLLLVAAIIEVLVTPAIIQLIIRDGSLRGLQESFFTQ